VRKYTVTMTRVFEVVASNAARAADLVRRCARITIRGTFDIQMGRVTFKVSRSKED